MPPGNTWGLDAFAPPIVASPTVAPPIGAVATGAGNEAAPAMRRQPFWPRTSPAFARLRAAVRSMPHQPYILGVSGGADSMALACAMVAEQYPVYAVSVDHQLQAGSAAVSTAAITQLRERGAYGLVVPVEVPVGENMEAAARTARYQALSAPGLPIVVAHTMEDQAETGLLHLVRANFHGMERTTTIFSSAGERVELWRPFLTMRRADTAQACKELGLEIWQDPHNQNRDFRRVALRHEVMPLLAEVSGGDIIPALAYAATQAQAAQHYLTSQARVLLAEIQQPMAECSHSAELQELHMCGQLNARALARHPEVLSAQTIRLWLQQAGLTLSQGQSAAVMALVYSWHGQGEVAISGGWAVYRRKSMLQVRTQEKRSS
ncbi:MAG: tRNA lysidine(34) synthetase TilS [Corynebacterium sp.]|nr:tRNA lysidine(34) synthetase TilS [Corynebacterium sp.]